MEAALNQVRASSGRCEDDDVRRLSPLIHGHLNFLADTTSRCRQTFETASCAGSETRAPGLRRTYSRQRPSLSAESCSIATQTPSCSRPIDAEASTLTGS